MVPQTVEQVTTKKTEEAVDYMKMGLVKEIRKNGAIGMCKCLFKTSPPDVSH